MNVSELDVSMYPSAITGMPNESGSPRSEGTLHLSTIYTDMEQEALVRRRKEMTEEDLKWYAAGGFLWERVFSMAHREAMLDADPDLVRPDEWELDGIVGSPDAIRISCWRLVELKARWMSAWKFDQLEKYFWLELIQCKGYCKLIGTTEVELIVFFVAGDWRPPIPQVRGALLEFTEQEIEESWRSIVRHARRKGWL